VQFIATVIPEPKLLLLDEPFSGLDPVSAEAIRSAILDLRRHGVTVILSTHDMYLAESLCDYIFMIFRGRKVLDGTIAPYRSVWRGHHTGQRQRRHRGGRAASRGRANPRPGTGAELRLARGADPQEVLRACWRRLK